MNQKKYLIIRWCVSVFLLTGVMVYISSPLTALCLLISALLICPAISKKLDIKLKPRLQIIIAAVLFLFAIMIAPNTDESLDEDSNATTTTEAVEVTTEAVEVTTEEVEVTTEAASQNILMGELQTEEVMNGLGDEVIGERAFIEITKKQLKSLTEDEYAEFAENVVEDSGYNWVSIICDDGTGITFEGSMSIISTYGEMDESDGKISEPMGNITYSDSGYTYSEY